MHSDKIDEFSQKNRQALNSGGSDRIASQHDKGKLTARERIDILLDEGSFVEIDSLITHHYHEFGMQKKKFYGGSTSLPTTLPFWAARSARWAPRRSPSSWITRSATGVP